jgi:hypothetical protein
MRRSVPIFLALAVLVAAPAFLFAGDDDDTLNLSPVQKGADKMAPTPAPTVAPTEAPTASAAATAVPTALPTQAPTAAPTLAPAPRPLQRVPALRSLDIVQLPEGIRLVMKAGGRVNGAAANLAAPDRVLIKLVGATLAGSRVPKEKAINLGSAVRVRLATKSASELWVVVDLKEKVAFSTGQPSADTFEVTLMTGGAKPVPTVEPTPRVAAEVPKVNLMLFDLNVVYQDKQYERFPCANFIYNAADTFPLKRDFVSTLVFHDGYGAFVGNVRVLDPEGTLVAQTEQPFAFNLFNRLTDFMVELPWKVEFKEKGNYSLFLALNGADVLKQNFYVGHNTDSPPAE